MMLCPEGEMRAQMTDDEFWAHVYHQHEFDDPRQPDQQEVAEYELNAKLADPCPECGQYGACSYDQEGRALIHVINNEEGND